MVCTAIFALTTPARATALLQLTMEQMTAASTEIVQGTVSGSHTALSGSTIFTHYTIQVSQRWKGANNPTTDVAIPGGLLNGVRQSFPGVPVLASGQQYLLFLWQGGKGPNQLVGLNQGLLEVGTDASGLMMVSRRATGEAMLASTGKPVVDQPVRIKLSEVRARLAAALAIPKAAR